jgi:hypothetical protein
VITVSLYERNNTNDPLRTVPFEWYVQGRSRIVNLRLRNTGDVLTNVIVDVKKLDDSFEGGEELVEMAYFSAKKAADSVYIPLDGSSAFQLAETLETASNADFDLKLNVPASSVSSLPLLCVNPTSALVERASAILQIRGYDVANSQTLYEDSLFEEFLFEEGNPLAYAENVIDYVLLEVAILTSGMASLLEQNGIILPQ